MIDENVTPDFDKYSTREHDARYAGWRHERRLHRAEMRAARFYQPLNGLFWGPLFVLIGVLSLPAVTGHLSGKDLAACWLLGLGGVLIIGGLVRGLRPGRLVAGLRLQAGIVLVIIGALVALGLTQWWPLVLLALGLAIIIRPLFGRYASD